MNEVLKIESQRLEKKIISEAEFINFKLCFDNFNINLDKINEVEEKTYKEMNLSEIKRTWLIYKNFQKVTENIINDMIGIDIRLLSDKDTWVTKNMDSLYNIKLDHLVLNEEVLNKTLPKSKGKIRNKIIKCNIIITTLFRNEKIFIHNRLKEDMEFELKEKIRYTKGYIVCIHPDLVNKMKSLEYYRKTITNNKIEIKANKEDMTVEEYLNNENYSKPIWVKDNNITDIKNKNIKILNNNLKEKIDTKDFVENINFLNQIELKINKESLEKTYEFIDKEIEIQDLYITKNKLIENIYRIDEGKKSITIGEDTENIELQRMINSASVLEIIKKQVNRYETFYINNAYDSRMRIYAQTWPINYQLTHIIRATILINRKIDTEVVYENFKRNDIIKENYIKCNDSLINRLNEENNRNIEMIINEKMKWKEYKEIKKECLIMLLSRLSPNNIKDINEKIYFGISMIDEFIEIDIKENWNYLKEKLKIKKNKIPYLISLKENLLKTINDDFSETYWLDASSNAIQLIALRMGCKNKYLLKLANIIDNDTEYENIYDYVNKKIKEEDHKNLIKSINNKLNKEEIDSLRDKEDSKYLIMPACYGMGKYKNRKNIENKLKENKIWNRLEEKEKNKINDYFWEKTFKILEEIGFNLEEYKKICNELKDYDAFMWKNDIGLTIAPITIVKSRRQELLKKENELKMKIKEIKNNKKINNERIEEIQNRIERIKEKVNIDDKEFWKRTMIKIENNKINKKIYIRIPNVSGKIDKRMTLQALTPNTIHSYDASVMFLCIKICRELNIEILVIHDCIGCQLIHAPIVKKIFKIANIEIIKRSLQNKPFPIKELNINKEEFEELKKAILESTNFFR